MLRAHKRSEAVPCPIAGIHVYIYIYSRSPVLCVHYMHHLMFQLYTVSTSWNQRFTIHDWINALNRVFQPHTVVAQDGIFSAPTCIVINNTVCWHTFLVYGVIMCACSTTYLRCQQCSPRGLSSGALSGV